MTNSASAAASYRHRENHTCLIHLLDRCVGAVKSIYNAYVVQTLSSKQLLEHRSRLFDIPEENLCAKQQKRLRSGVQDTFDLSLLLQILRHGRLSHSNAGGSGSAASSSSASVSRATIKLTKTEQKGLDEIGNFRNFMAHPDNYIKVEDAVYKSKLVVAVAALSKLGVVVSQEEIEKMRELDPQLASRHSELLSSFHSDGIIRLYEHAGSRCTSCHELTQPPPGSEPAANDPGLKSASACHIRTDAVNGDLASLSHCINGIWLCSDCEKELREAGWQPSALNSLKVEHRKLLSAQKAEAELARTVKLVETGASEAVKAAFQEVARKREAEARRLCAEEEQLMTEEWCDEQINQHCDETEINFAKHSKHTFQLCDAVIRCIKHSPTLLQRLVDRLENSIDSLIFERPVVSRLCNLISFVLSHHAHHIAATDGKISFQLSQILSKIIDNAAVDQMHRPAAYFHSLQSVAQVAIDHAAAYPDDMLYLINRIDQILAPIWGGKFRLSSRTSTFVNALGAIVLELTHIRINQASFGGSQLEYMHLVLSPNSDSIDIESERATLDQIIMEVADEAETQDDEVIE